MRRRRASWTGGAIAASLAVNLALLGAAALLSSKQSRPVAEIDPIAVNLVSLTPPEPPARREAKEPEKPKPRQKSEFAPDLVRPDFSAATGGMDLGVVVNLGDLGVGDIGGDTFVFEAYELDQAPQPIVRVPPIYPYRAREQGIEGEVQVKLLVNADGTVGQVLVLGARPQGLFEDAVLKSVPQWKFTPGTIEGEAVTAWVVTTVRFNL